MGGPARLKLLLDTHIWLWSALEPARLGRRVALELIDSKNELWLSPISTWEALALHRRKRLRLDDDPCTWLTEAMKNFREASLTHEIAMTAHRLTMHADPADRFIVATAKVFGLTLVTADKNLLGLGDIATLANR
jgi:PIN domain nuclease of toxin-antitoxin system